MVPQENSYVLVMKVWAPSNDGESEPQTKRRRLSDLSPSTEEALRMYGADLVVYDRHSRCLLVDGDYELPMKELAAGEIHKASPGGAERSPRKGNASWSTVDTPVDSPVSLLAQGPLLKFRLEWANEPVPSLVDRYFLLLLHVQILFVV